MTGQENTENYKVMFRVPTQHLVSDEMFSSVMQLNHLGGWVEERWGGGLENQVKP